MTVREILELARAEGVELLLSADGDMIIPHGRGPISPALRETLVAHKSDVLAYLAAAPGPHLAQHWIANTTQVPNVVFDFWLPDLDGSELKVLLYIIRRTLGFQKLADHISFKQFLEGIKTRDGTQLDRGCMRSRGHLSAALRSLEARGLIRSFKALSGSGDADVTVYSIWFQSPAGVVPNGNHQVPNGHYGGSQRALGVVPNGHYGGAQREPTI